jgi:hypothetical protein
MNRLKLEFQIVKKTFKIVLVRSFILLFGLFTESMSILHIKALDETTFDFTLSLIKSKKCFGKLKDEVNF